MSLDIKALTMYDPWYHLRQECFGNVEPVVTLEAITAPILHEPEKTDYETIELLPALAAGTSYGSRGKLQDSDERAIKLNRNLIKLGHHTPLEAIQFNLHVSGISKACGAQVSRHRVGQGHVSASRRFKKQEPGFIYPMLAYIEDEAVAKRWLSEFSDINKLCFERYNRMRDGDDSSLEQTLKKEDARLAIPVSSATERSWWINARALRDFFRLRLAPDAEWEIRRLSQMIFNIVFPMLPSIFEDVYDKFGMHSQ